jgi:hypothetical protein
MVCIEVLYLAYSACGDETPSSSRTDDSPRLIHLGARLGSIGRPDEPATHPQTRFANSAHIPGFKRWALFNPGSISHGTKSVLIHG